ncbi:hypothetical protein SAMD00019534_034970 [Acytostelium subglobosum LB1]|uniref:hypothetical protein n=1 Tax=Acytostelium subglobosum LB1 TaxID=1410327 RepID=UPI000645140A|nr:hypothetical protein SAMD00019534_034970 [Acytostelium subglobosum LB1]GAM20322.1 hypothetical protein SAMD00019534_034970 [Acytostelium subglobosum LB1]|eukprot:XP_012759843.1 hypothetical protein SAMD00019534_034970 [Acytostelium subglobosum LB1]
MFKSFARSSASLLKTNSSSVVGRRSFATETANEELLTFSFMVPHQILFKEKRVQMLTLPGARGVFGVLKNHIPKIAELKPGVVQVHHESGDIEKYFISGGFAFINPDASCYINAVEAVPVDQLDAAEVKTGLARYTQLYNEAADETAKATALIGLEVHQQMAYAVGVAL